MLAGTIVGHGVMDGSNVLPHEDISLLPMRYVAILGLELVLEEEFEYFFTLVFRQLVDPHRITGIGVQHFAAGERVGRENRLRYRGLGFSLCVGKRRAFAAFLAPHHLPELLEVVKHRLAFEAALHFFRQTLVGRMHVAELGCPEWLAVAMRNLDAIKHVRESDRAAVRHVCMPALSRVRKTDGSSVLHD